MAHRHEYRVRNSVDGDGNPAGGEFRSQGLAVDWQDGPVAENGENGTQVEMLIVASIARLEFLQASQFKCKENTAALRFLRKALMELDERTRRRKAEGVEGTNRGA